MYNIIPFLIISVSLLIIIVIIVRKFPALTSIDVDSLHQEKQNKLKEKIVINRIKRRLNNILKSVKLDKIKTLSKGKFNDFYEKLLNKEREYKIFHKNNRAEKAKDSDNVLEHLLAEAEFLLKSNDLKSAEKKYIEVISFDPKNIKAYEGLGEIYFRLRQFFQAEEVLKHLIKIDKKNENAFFRLGEISLEKGDKDIARKYFLKAIKLKDHYAPYLLSLAEVCQSLDYNDEALSYAKQAVNLESNNPKYLDKLIELSILVNDKTLAKESLKKLKEINPQNKNILKYKQLLKK